MNAEPNDPANRSKLIASWLLVGLPFAWGVYITIGNVAALFR
jgi:hypothetical protein